MTSLETLELEAVDAALAGRYVAPEHAELADLALLLRDDKPQPTPAWATHLDRRVEAGFPARPKERKTWIWLRSVAPAFGLAATVVLLIVGATTLPQGGDDSEGGGGSMAAEDSGASGASGGQELAPAVRDQSAGRTSGDPGSDGRAAVPALRAGGAGQGERAR
jgi:hypothetical protein